VKTGKENGANVKPRVTRRSCNNLWKNFTSDEQKQKLGLVSSSTDLQTQTAQPVFDGPFESCVESSLTAQQRARLCDPNGKKVLPGPPELFLQQKEE